MLPGQAKTRQSWPPSTTDLYLTTRNKDTDTDITLLYDNKKLRYREEHSVSFVLSWCIYFMTFLGRKSVAG